jgi:excisionase family DNA binding protein
MPARMQTNTDTNRNTVTVERKTISIMKACELVGVSRRTIYNWIAGGKVEYVRTAGGSVRIFVDTLWRQPSRSSDLATKEAS